LFGSGLSKIPLSMINIQKLLPLKATTAIQTIPASEASRHVGERSTVCGRIASEHNATKGRPTFINLDKPYPDRAFTVLVWGSDRANVGAVPSSGMLCVTGLVSSYRGIPAIVIKDAEGWYVPK
jgi:micrococcal nuclease